MVVANHGPIPIQHQTQFLSNLSKPRQWHDLVPELPRLQKNILPE